MVEAVETDSVGPFPVIPAFCVDCAAVGEFEEEVAGCVADVDQIVCQGLDVRVDVCGFEAGYRQWRRHCCCVQSGRASVVVADTSAFAWCCVVKDV